MRPGARIGCSVLNARGPAAGCVENSDFHIAVRTLVSIFLQFTFLAASPPRPARGPWGWRAQKSLAPPERGKLMNENPVDLWRDDRIRVSLAEGARLLSISKRMLEYRIAAKQIRTVRDGRRVFILISDLRSYARTNHYDSPRPYKARK